MILSGIKTYRFGQRKDDVDDIDHLGNRCAPVGELVATNAFRVGLLRLERSVRENAAGPAAEDLTPMQLVNARPIIASVNDFFRTSQLSTMLDQTNPLAEVDITATYRWEPEEFPRAASFYS